MAPSRSVADFPVHEHLRGMTRQRSIVRYFVAARDGTSATLIPIDSATHFQATFSSSAALETLTLVDPRGGRHPVQADKDPAGQRERTSKFSVFIDKPLPGPWKVDARPSGRTERAMVHAYVNVGSPVAVEILGDETAHDREPRHTRIFVNDDRGTAPTIESVSAVLQYSADPAAFYLPTAKAGDFPLQRVQIGEPTPTNAGQPGLTAYDVQLVPEKPGAYVLLVSVKGTTASGEAFERLARDFFLASRRTAAIAGDVREGMVGRYGRSPDNALRADVPVSINEPGSYVVTVGLEGSNGRVEYSSASVDVDKPGETKASCLFPEARMRSVLGGGPPYLIAEVSVVDMNSPGTPMVVDRRDRTRVAFDRAGPTSTWNESTGLNAATRPSSTAAPP
jgi:hypothetical protein